MAITLCLRRPNKIIKKDTKQNKAQTKNGKCKWVWNKYPAKSGPIIEAMFDRDAKMPKTSPRLFCSALPTAKLFMTTRKTPWAKVVINRPRKKSSPFISFNVRFATTSMIYKFSFSPI